MRSVNGTSTLQVQLESAIREHCQVNEVNLYFSQQAVRTASCFERWKNIVLICQLSELDCIDGV